jgi:hypothetical protein
VEGVASAVCRRGGSYHGSYLSGWPFAVLLGATISKTLGDIALLSRSHPRGGFPRRFSELAVFAARFYIGVRCVDEPAAFVGVSGLSFTWRMNLPVPCNKRAGSGSAAP